MDPDTKVDVNTGMIAAGRLQSLIDSRAGQPDLLQVRLQFNQILNAVKSTVPEEMWGDIVEKLDQAQQPALSFDDETDRVEEVFDPDCGFDDEV